MTFELQGASISILVTFVQFGFRLLFFPFCVCVVPFDRSLYCSANVLFTLVDSLKSEWNNLVAVENDFSLKGGVSKTEELKTQ